jgi:tetratricopeptide (TPR) repeat protein
MAKAAAELGALTAIDENAYAANVKLGALLDGLGDAPGAAAALDRAIYIYPYDRELHEHLATLYARSADREGVVRARRALVALNPVDKAAAHYELAEALLSAGDRAGARTEVLRALETAPNYPEAQALLLRLRSGGTRSPSPIDDGGGD